MSNGIKRYLRWRWVGLGALVAMCTTSGDRDAGAVGMAQVMTEKSLPEATVQVIDPESGSSSGTGGSDVKIAVGDVILFRFAVSPVPDKRNRGMQAYLTEYVPPGTEVVGVRIIDANGRTIEPRYPGLARDGCAGGSDCNDFDNLPCSAGAGCSGGQVSFAGGSIAQVHGDTGVFFSNDPRVTRTPNNVFITPTNGIQMSPEPNGIDPDLTPLLGYSAPYFAHNAWDWAQVRAFGTSTDVAGTGGGGNAPYLYASPVAGPQTFYKYEATDNGGSIEFNDVVGPWNRIRYPGSKIGFGDCLSNTSAGIACSPEAQNDVQRKIADAAGGNLGTDVTPNNPVTAKAIRFALGQSRTGEPVFVEVALRVTAVPIDPNFGAMGDNVNCGEIFGAGLSMRDTGQDGAHHPWASYIGSPQCVFLRTLLDIDVDKDLAVSEQVTYTIRAKNLSLNTETNVVVYQQYDSTRISFVSAVPAADGPPAACPVGLDTNKMCLRWTIGAMAPSDENIFNTTFTTGGGGGTTAVTQAVFASDFLPLPGYQTNALTIITGIARPAATLAPSWVPTAAFASANSTATLVGTLSNSGTQGFVWDRVIVNLPAGWTVNGGISVGGTLYPCTANCSTSSPEFDYPVSFAVGDSRALSIDVNVPPGTADGLYDVALQVWGTQSGFGGDYETIFPELATVNVGKVRTDKPVIACPLGSTAPTVDGTSEPNADISLRFNLMERGTCTADGAGAWSCGFSSFGPMYGGLEVRATATAPGELESELSDACETTPQRQCSDGLDNDGDGLIDFPADPGCDSPTDSSEDTESSFQCMDRVDNDTDTTIDWPDDLSCYAPEDTTEGGNPACSDGLDNDGDGLTDFPNDPDCADANDPTEQAMPACMDRIDNDGDGKVDFPDDPGCHSSFDDTETDLGFTPADTKPRILIVFDTSGSMNWNTCEDVFTEGDGSLDCPGTDVDCGDLPAGCTGGSALTCGNGNADDSRLFKVKEGVSNVIAGFGEVEWGLMRFHQRGSDFACPTRNAGLQSGGWQGGGANPCGGGFNGGDVVVSFSPDNQQTLIRWMDGDANYSGAGDPPARLDFELRGTGTTPLAGALGDALTYVDGVKTTDPRAACRPYRVILVTDGQETCGGDPVASATALKNAGYFVSVIGFATSDAAVVTQLNNIAAAGSQSGTDSAVFVDEAAELSSAIATIVSDSIITELCNSLDDDCDGLIDEDFPDLGNTCTNGQSGNCARTGTIVCTSDERGTECNATDGSGSATTEVCNNDDDDCDGKIDEGLTCNCGPEVCNGLDDDCDGSVDEAPLPGVNSQCGIDIGECEFGTIQCVDPDNNPATPDSRLECTGGVNPAASDPCDNLDNDCDTLIDEDAGSVQCYPPATSGCVDNGSGGFTCMGICSPGTQSCVGGVPGACTGATTPTTEECNGIDDDCDGTIDEDWKPDPNGHTLGGTCDNGAVGACNATGLYACDVSNPTGPLICTAPTVSPGAEQCNGLDDDCDGTIDEVGPPPPDGLPQPPIGAACGGTGCTPGTLQCVDPDMDPLTPNSEIQCVGQMGGSPETCNAIDDDCDMLVDEDIAGVGVDCYPAGLAGCTSDGMGGFNCEGQCAPGTTVCSPPSIVCTGHTGPAAEDTCDGQDNDCDGNIDEMADCPNPGEICYGGECIFPCDVTEFPCPFGFFCETLDPTVCSNPPCRFCLPDPCVNVTCNAGEVCNQQTGMCEDPCVGVTCQPGETCSFGSCFDCFDPGFGCTGSCEVCERDGNDVGQCVIDPCCGVTCSEGEFCQDGNCVSISCNPACATGEVCVNGQCVPDLCDGVQCPGSQLCDPNDGMCKGDLCSGTFCRPGEACDPANGNCIPDPCRNTTCASGLECEVTFGGSPTCVPIDDGGYDIYAGGGGGCSCSSHGSGSGVLLVLLAGLLAVCGRRRRRAR